jgi:hypothetical protein
VEAAVAQGDAVLALARPGDLEQHAEVRHRHHLGPLPELPELLEGGGERTEVAAVGGEEHDAAEAGPGQRAHQVRDHRVERLLLEGQGAGKVDVVGRAPHPHARRDEGVEPVRYQLSEVIAKQRVRGEGQMPGVLLRGAERDHHGVSSPAQLGFHLRPAQLVELDRGHSAEGIVPLRLVACGAGRVRAPLR